MITLDEFHEKYGRLPTEKDKDWNFEVERGKVANKLTVLEMPLMAPGRCLCCGANQKDGRKYIDFGVEIDPNLHEEQTNTPAYYWVLYLCEYCVKQAAGLVTPEKIEEKADVKVNELSEVAYDLDRPVDTLKPVENAVSKVVQEEINGLREFIRVEFDKHHNGLSAVAEQETGREPETDSGEAVESAAEPTRPSSSGRSSNVQSLADLLKNRAAGSG